MGNVESFGVIREKYENRDITGLIGSSIGHDIVIGERLIEENQVFGKKTHKNIFQQLNIRFRTQVYHLQNEGSKALQLQISKNHINCWDLKMLQKIKIKVDSNVNNCHTLKLVFNGSQEEFFGVRKRDLKPLFSHILLTKLSIMGHKVKRSQS